MHEHTERGTVVPALPPETMEPTGPSPHATDARLLERVGRGDPAALSLLYETHCAAAFGLALHITRDANLAEDVVQEAFLAAWRGAATYCPDRASVRTWLLSIVHHRSIDLVRRRRSASDVEARVTAGATFETPDVWSAVRERLDADAIAAALLDLPTAQRTVIEMAYFGGLTQVEIAAATATPVGTVKSRARLGLLALRRSLERGTARAETRHPRYDGWARGARVQGNRADLNARAS